MMIVSVVVLVQQDVLLKQSARVLLITKSTLMFVLIVVLVLEHVQLALLTHSSLNKIQINVHQMVFNVPEWYLHKTPDQFNTDSGFYFLAYSITVLSLLKDLQILSVPAAMPS